MEKRITTRSVFDGRIFTVTVDDVELDSGRRTTREIVRRPDTVSVLAVDDRGQVLLVRQYRYAVGSETLEIPAGTIEPGESAVESARRELREETGYDCRELTELIAYGPAIGYCTEQMTIFLARDLAYSPLKGDEEFIRLERRSFDELHQQITKGAPVFRDAKSIMAILIARSRGLA